MIFITAWKNYQEIDENFSDIVSILAMSPFNEENKNILSTEEEGIFILWLARQLDISKV